MANYKPEEAPLTSDETKIVKSIWSTVMTDPNTHGVNFFLRFFRDNPNYQEKFKSLKDIGTEEELKTSKRLKAHASQVLYTITALVDNLDDMECAGEMLEKISVNHLRRSINWPFFENLRKSLIGFMLDTLGPETMDTKAIEAWNKVLNLITETVKNVETVQTKEDKS